VTRNPSWRRGIFARIVAVDANSSDGSDAMTSMARSLHHHNLKELKEPVVLRPLPGLPVIAI